MLVVGYTLERLECREFHRFIFIFSFFCLVTLHEYFETFPRLSLTFTLPTSAPLIYRVSDVPCDLVPN